jgi:hypothetical protein
VASAGWDRGGGSLATRRSSGTRTARSICAPRPAGSARIALRLDVGVRYRFGRRRALRRRRLEPGGGSAGPGVRAARSRSRPTCRARCAWACSWARARASRSSATASTSAAAGGPPTRSAPASTATASASPSMRVGRERSRSPGVRRPARLPARGGRLTGRVGARYQVELDAWTVNASAGWDVGERAVGASAGVAWRDGAWRAELDASVGYGWGATAAAGAPRPRSRPATRGAGRCRPP